MPKTSEKKTVKRKPSAAFLKAMQPDAALAKIVGDKAVPRTEIPKKLWEYIHKNGLQDKKDKRLINADDLLKEIFDGKKQVTMFEMTALANKHLSSV